MPKSSAKKKPKPKDLGSDRPPEDTPSEEDTESFIIGPNEIMKEIKGFRAETAGNFETIKADITGLKGEIGQLKERLDAAEERIVENESSDMEMTRVLIQILRTQKLLQEKCENLESRARRTNLRIYAIPEKSNMVDFIIKFLSENLGVTGVHIERAHQSTVKNPRAGRTEQPRSIVIRFQSYAEKHRVLQAAWTKKEVRLNGQGIFFDEDFTAHVYKERAKYIKVRKQLLERNIKTRILYPARLKVFVAGGHVKVFDNPQAAAEGLQEFGITMESFAKEPDLEAILQAAGWESPRSRSGAGRGGDFTRSIKTLLSSPARHPTPKNNEVCRE